MCALLLWPFMTVSRLRALARELGAVAAFAALAERDPIVHEVLSRGPAAGQLLAAPVEVGELLDRATALHRRATAEGSIWLPGDDHWIDQFGDHTSQPAMLFVAGTFDALTRPRVALVGTRAATPAGREMARRLGAELTDAGVSVVSGLAYGIDTSAHRGAMESLDASPIGVVGSGLDVAYPQVNGALWRSVQAHGLMVSEYPPGTAPLPRHFPARNRIIAALSQIVVVVESTTHGGSMLTADEAHRWRRTLMAVPGNPLHPSSQGSNELMRTRNSERPVYACLGTADILSLLMIDAASSPTYRDPRPTPNAVGEAVLVALGWESLSTSRLVDLTGLSPSSVAVALDSLEGAGWVESRNGLWSQRTAFARTP